MPKFESLCMMWSCVQLSSLHKHTSDKYDANLDDFPSESSIINPSKKALDRSPDIPNAAAYAFAEICSWVLSIFFIAYLACSATSSEK